MQIDHEPTKILVVGRSGCGKTTYLQRVIESRGSGSQLFVFDHKNELARRCNLETSWSLAEVTERLSRGETRVCYHYSSEYPGQVEVAFQDWCSYCYEFCRSLEEQGDGYAGQSLFACDEVNRFTTNTDMGDAFKLLIEDGRLQGLDFIGTSHASNQISNRLRLQLSELVAMHTIDKRPLQFLEDCGFDPQEVETLQVGEYICRDLQRGGETRNRLFASTRAPQVATPEADLNDQPPTEPDHGPIPDASSGDHVLSGDR